MDPEVKTAIFAELDHKINDSNEKTNINQISENWEINFHECSEILQEWCKTQEKLELKQEFLVRGLDKNGVARICIVAKNKLDAVQEKFEKFHSTLFAVEKASDTNFLDLEKFSEGKRISLPLESKIRPQETFLVEDEEESTPKPCSSKIIPAKKEPVTPKKEPVTPKKKVESKNSVTSMFANAKPKAEKVSPPQEKKSVEESPVAKPKVEAKTPTKGKNVKSTPTKKKGSNTHAATGRKTSIASFFGNAPARKAPTKEEPITPAKAKPVTPAKDKLVTPAKDKPAENMETEEIISIQDSGEVPETPSVQKEPESTRKRSMTNESEDEVVTSSQKKSNPSKRFKSQEKKKMRKRGNRIMQMSDSSDEEEKENNNKETEESEDKQEESEVESTPQKEPLAKKRRPRIKQQKYRTYEDENGYLVSEKYVEEVSVSEDEVETVPEPKEQEMKKVEKKTTPKAATKQGSIMSFFGKK